MRRVYYHGLLLTDSAQKPVTNGDYVRITLNVEPGPHTSALMARELQFTPNEPGLEYCEEGAIEIRPKRVCCPRTFVEGESKQRGRRVTFGTFGNFIEHHVWGSGR